MAGWLAELGNKSRGLANRRPKQANVANVANAGKQALIYILYFRADLGMGAGECVGWQYRTHWGDSWWTGVALKLHQNPILNNKLLALFYEWSWATFYE